MVDKAKQSPDKADVVVDALGKRCPMPILDLRDNIEKAKAGQTLELISDDAGSKADVPAFCRRTGSELLKTWVENGTFHFLIRKKK
jgi:tRNA 2-thiouridine synthesizing protein A